MALARLTLLQKCSAAEHDRLIAWCPRSTSLHVVRIGHQRVYRGHCDIQIMETSIHTLRLQLAQVHNFVLSAGLRHADPEEATRTGFHLPHEQR